MPHKTPYHLQKYLFHPAILLACANRPRSPASRVNRGSCPSQRNTSRNTWTCFASHATIRTTFQGIILDLPSALDTHATPYARMGSTGGDDVINFNCDGLASLIREAIQAALRSGVAPEDRTPRLRRNAVWTRGVAPPGGVVGENPGKRRFPRRRQHYRAVLCAGLKTCGTCSAWRCRQR